MSSQRQDLDERALAEAGLENLRAILGQGWTIAPVDYGSPETRNRAELSRDLIIAVSAPGNAGSSGPILVEAKRTLTPAGARDLLPRLALMMSLTGDATALVVSSWLSPQTRATLDENGIGYLDLTGNVSFRLNRPGVVLRLQGSERAPTPEQRSSRSLRGERAGALIRMLIDFAPPLQASQLVGATGLSPSYVSRLLETMEREALIERERRRIVHVDWQRLLRARAAEASLLTALPTYAVAPEGPSSFLRKLSDWDRELQRLGPVARRPIIAVTGPAAAERVSPLTGDPTPVIVYLSDEGSARSEDREENVEELVEATGLLRSPHGRTDVWIINDPARYVFANMSADDVPVVSLSQIALDCLSGPGRMPAQGDAVIEHMIRTEKEWRRSATFLPVGE